MVHFLIFILIFILSFNCPWNKTPEGYGAGMVFVDNLESDIIDDGYYFIDDGIVKYDYQTGNEERVVSLGADEGMCQHIYSGERYLVYQVRESQGEGDCYSLRYSNKKNGYQSQEIVSSETELNWVVEENNIFIYDEDVMYFGEDALIDMASLELEKEAIVHRNEGDGNSTEVKMDNGKTVRVFLDGSYICYEVDSQRGWIDGIDKYDFSKAFLNNDR